MTKPRPRPAGFVLYRGSPDGVIPTYAAAFLLDELIEARGGVDINGDGFDDIAVIRGTSKRLPREEGRRFLEEISLHLDPLELLPEPVEIGPLVRRQRPLRFRARPASEVPSVRIQTAMVSRWRAPSLQPSRCVTPAHGC
ncbi:MAG: FG-GAP repeat protein [Myxococcales bacterium]|nr:FG-GAP repeat protein [Myxococcales bacterium]